MDEEFEEGDVVIVTSPTGATCEGFIKRWHGELVLECEVGERYLRVFREMGYFIESK